MLTVRLPAELEIEVDRLASTEKKTKSDIVKAALQEYVTSHRELRSSFEIGRDLFGMVSSGDTDRSTTYKNRLRERLREKYSH